MSEARDDELELEVNAEAVADEDPDDILEADELDEAAGDEIELETPEQPDSDDAIELDEADDVAPRGSRRQQRIRQLANETRLLKQKLAERDAQIEQHRLMQSAPPPAQVPPPRPDPAAQAEIDRQEAEFVASLMPEERGTYWEKRLLEQTRQREEFHELRLADRIDQVELRWVMREQNLPRHYEAVVEHRLAQARAMGLNLNRQWILDQVLGEEARKRRPQEIENARQRVASQAVRPISIASTVDAGLDRRRRSRDDEGDELLRNTSWRDFSRST